MFVCDRVHVFQSAFIALHLRVSVCLYMPVFLHSCVCGLCIVFVPAPVYEPCASSCL